MTAAAFAGEHPNCKAVQAAELMKRIADELDDGRMPALPSVSEVMNIVRANADAVAAT